jgi:hypothetical protein
MSFQGTFFNVMVGSPSDVASALSVVREALARWNVMHSEEKGVALLPMSWQTHSSPELGSPAQAVINRQLISRSDLLIAVFWTRLGTPTGEADSGTIEEILKHIEQGKPVMLYFCEKDVPFSQLDHDQHAKLKAFRSKVEGLYDIFKTDDELREKVERHLNKKVQEHSYFAAAKANRSPEAVVAGQPTISKEALEILILAVKGPDANIGRVQLPEGVFIATRHGGRTASNARESAKNESIIRELENVGFIEDLGTDRDSFRVTAEGFEYVDKNGPPPTPESQRETVRRATFLEVSKRLPNIVGGQYLNQCWPQLQQGLSEAEAGASFGISIEKTEQRKLAKTELLGYVSNGIKKFSLILPPDVEPLIKSLGNLAREASPEDQTYFSQTIEGMIPPGIAIWALLDALRRKDSELLDALQILGIDTFAITFFTPLPRKPQPNDLAAVLARPG